MKFLLVGDVMIGRLVNDILRGKPPAYTWGDTLPVFRDADIRICNLECVISDRGAPWSITPKVFHFRSDAGNIETLKIAGIKIVSLANNHALDYEYEALFEMLKILDKAGIYHAGAGVNFSEASMPALFKAKGVRIGFIAFTDNESDWGATIGNPGIFYVPIDINNNRAKKLFEIISCTRKQTDFLIVSTHGNWK